MKTLQRIVPLLALFSLTFCTSTKPVNMSEPRRVLGTDNDVRVDAEIYGETLSPSSNIAIKCDVTNNRSTPILVADLIPQASYDPEAQTVTVDLGSEIPGAQFLPRLLSIAPSGRRTFTTAARVVIRGGSPPVAGFRRPNALRIRVNFLGGEIKPFQSLVDIPERAVHDPVLASAIFTRWVDRNETVTTNALPMRWVGTSEDSSSDASRRGRRP